MQGVEDTATLGVREGAQGVDESAFSGKVLVSNKLVFRRLVWRNRAAVLRLSTHILRTLTKGSRRWFLALKRWLACLPQLTGESCACPSSLQVSAAELSAIKADVENAPSKQEGTHLVQVGGLVSIFLTIFYGYHEL